MSTLILIEALPEDCHTFSWQRRITENNNNNGSGGGDDVSDVKQLIKN
jgi:hypothetical protein